MRRNNISSLVNVWVVPLEGVGFLVGRVMVPSCWTTDGNAVRMGMDLGNDAAITAFDVDVVVVVPFQQCDSMIDNHLGCNIDVYIGLGAGVDAFVILELCW